MAATRKELSSMKLVLSDAYWVASELLYLVYESVAETEKLK
jgi:hypothetical protein